MSARDIILSKLASTSSDDAIDQEAAALLIAPERPMVESGDLVSAFLAKLALPSLAATHDRIDGLAALPGAIARYLADHDEAPVLCLPPDPAFAACDWAGFTLHETAASDEPAALAIARCGVAETGSLVLETSPVAPMLPNFLALHHIILLRSDAIVAHLEEAILPGVQPRAHYWITGVSGTTDIEGTYVRGAHGPRFLHIILLDDAQPSPPRL